MASRHVIHADVDAFYASVEQRDDPALRGRPIAVGGSPSHRGVIMTASYEARRFGVGSAMPSRAALALCPQLTILPPRFDAYHAASRTIMAVFRDHADLIEPLSLDEAFLDITRRAPAWSQSIELAGRIKDAVRAETQLSVSLGLSTTKLVAKIASDFDKPDGLTVVAEGEERHFMAELPIRKLWGVGPKTEEALRRAGIHRIGQLVQADEDWLLSRLGPWALRWRSMAQGRDDRPVAPREKAKQVSRELTFDRDVGDLARLRSKLSEMADDVASSLAGTGPARTIHVKIRYTNFRTITRQSRSATVLVSADQIRTGAFALLDECWSGRPVRLIGLGVSNFVTVSPDQLSLFAAVEGPWDGKPDAGPL